MTHVFLSHHHPDHTINIALFPNAEVVDFWARYRNDLWLDHEGDGHRLSPNTELWLTPGHTEEDATLIVRADDATYALTHLWWFADRTPEVDPLGCRPGGDRDGSLPGACRGRHRHPWSRRAVPRPRLSRPQAVVGGASAGIEASVDGVGASLRRSRSPNHDTRPPVKRSAAVSSIARWKAANEAWFAAAASIGVAPIGAGFSGEYVDRITAESGSIVGASAPSTA